MEDYDKGCFKQRKIMIPDETETESRRLGMSAFCMSGQPFFR